MHEYQRQFLAFAIETEVLRFGRFTLKSGRESPYFFNAGAFSTGRGLARLGRYYAEALRHSGLGVDMLFGPAYKGIPLAACTAIALAEHYAWDLPFAFNRKEAKAHGEGGRESVALIRAAGAEPAGVLIALDRCERGAGALAATAEIAAEYGIATVSIVTLHDLVDYLDEHGDQGGFHASLEEYRENYGVGLTLQPTRSDADRETCSTSQSA